MEEAHSLKVAMPAKSRPASGDDIASLDNNATLASLIPKEKEQPKSSPKKSQSTSANVSDEMTLSQLG